MNVNAISIAGALVSTAVFLSPPVAAQPVHESTSSVQRFSDGSTVAGAFTVLVRSADAIRMQVKTSDLDPGPPTRCGG